MIDLNQFDPATPNLTLFKTLQTSPNQPLPTSSKNTQLTTWLQKPRSWRTPSVRPMSGMTQLRLDLGQLATSITERRWTRSEDHIVTLGMKYRSTWRDQHATISRKRISRLAQARTSSPVGPFKVLSDLEGYCRIFTQLERSCRILKGLARS